MEKEDQALSHYRYTDQHFVDRHMPFPEEDGFLSGYRAACEDKDKRIEELEAENNKARELIDDLIQAALNDCVESIEWGEVEERARAFLINQSEEGKDD